METDTIPGFRIKQMSTQLLVDDVNRSLEFYINNLGFEVEFRYQDFYCSIMKDGFSIHLKSGNPSKEERERKKTHEDLDILFSVDQIEELYEELSNKSIQVIQPLRTMDYGKEFYIADPDGYIIAFLEVKD